ncbi:MAG: 50S ribosomal protein L29 [Candidatus Diapherotrites archaeon]
MPNKKLLPLRDKSIEELEAEIVQLRTELGKEKASIAHGTRAEKPAKIKNIRRRIARILTIISEKNKGVKVK